MGSKTASESDVAVSDGTQILVIQPDANWPPRRFWQWLEAAGVEIVLVRPFLGEDIPMRLESDGLIVLGGGMSAYADEAYPWLSDIRQLYRQADEASIPVLGVCLGAQLLATTFAGEVTLDAPMGPEIGVVEVQWTEDARSDDLVGGLVGPLWAGAFHYDVVTQLPIDAVRLGVGNKYPNQIFRRGTAVGVQFHPEATPKMFLEWADVAMLEHPELKELIAAKVHEFERLDFYSRHEETKVLSDNFVKVVRKARAK